MGLLTSAIGGTILGKVLDLGSRWFDTYAARKQAEVDVMKAKALADLKIKEEELKAFTASQSQTEEAYDPDPLPSDAPWWAQLMRAVVDTIAVPVDSFRKFTRPALTWALAAVVTMLAFKGELPEAVRASLVSEIVFCAATALTWWFGSRPRGK